MIRFTNVRGDVLVDDRVTDDRVMARDELILKPGGDYLVVTTQSSSADLLAFGRMHQLPPFSFIRLRNNDSRQGKHSEQWWAPQTKQFLARIWALAGGRI